jgi:exodeoxyribonuclease VII small subunit
LTWIDIQGLGDEPLLRRVGEIFALHPLALEDLVNVPQRPKIEHYEEHLLLITRMVRLRGSFELIAEQVSLVLGPNWVLSIQEHYGDVLDPVRVRLREGKGPMRQSGTDYLAYALLDTIAPCLDTPMAKKPTEPKFEELVAQVEQALQQLDSGDLPLEDALKRYEEGVASLRLAFGILKKAEKKVQLLSEREGEVTTTDFDVEDEGEEEPAKKLF